MLSVNCPRAQAVKDALDGQVIEGISFSVVGQQGLRVIFRCEGGDDAQAKAVCKKVLAGLPALKNMVCSCQIVDEEGNLI